MAGSPWRGAALGIHHGHREPCLGLQNNSRPASDGRRVAVSDPDGGERAARERSVGGPIAATIISFTVGWFALLAINGAVFRQFPAVGDVVYTLLLLLIGGVLGATFLSANVYLAPRLGAAATLCFVIAGQIIAAMIIDRFGLFDFAVRDLSPGRGHGRHSGAGRRRIGAADLKGARKGAERPAKQTRARTWLSRAPCYSRLIPWARGRRVEGGRTWPIRISSSISIRRSRRSSESV